MHRVVEDFFETLHEDRLRAWFRVNKKGKKAGRAGHVPQFSADELPEVWITWTVKKRCITTEERHMISSCALCPVLAQAKATRGLYCQDRKYSLRNWPSGFFIWFESRGSSIDQRKHLVRIPIGSSYDQRKARYETNDGTLRTPSVHQYKVF
jgi:hypothetical protein